MKRESILHIPMSQYAHGISETSFVIRLRAAKDDLIICNLYYGDTACRETPILFHMLPMAVVASDLLFDYYEVEFVSPYHRLYYYFKLESRTEASLYYSDFFRESRVTERSEYYKLPFNHRNDIAVIPQWAIGTVIYNIFPDSFATEKHYISKTATQCSFQDTVTRGKLGGTIKGITENVGYIKELGIGCIYINPIFAAGEYHKYDTIDYFSVDPCFGTNDDFKELVRIFHENQIRVMIDGVFNHCGWEFFAFEDVVKKGKDSEYKDWFYRLEFPVVKPETAKEIPGYECFGYERLMPKLNTANQPTKEYLLEVGAYWIREFDIDGWRLDVASEVDDTFWREFRQVVKGMKPDCFLVGEVWESAAHWLEGDQFDSTMNYDLRKHCTYFFAGNTIDAEEFNGRVTHMRMRYKKNMLKGQLNLLDSHDASRFYSVCNNRVEQWKLAILFQMFFEGIPSVFYGDEQMLTGNEESDFRQGMRWDTENPMYLFYKKAIQIRNTYLPLRRGEFQTVSAEKGSYLYAFKRYDQQDSIIILLNAGAKDSPLPLLPDPFTCIWAEGLEKESLKGYGFALYLQSGCNWN